MPKAYRPLSSKVSNMSKIAVIFGTRPELIKLSPVVNALRQRIGDDAISTYSTGQHRELLAQAQLCLDTPIDVNFDVMTHAQSTSDVLAKTVTLLEAEFTQKRPELVVVQGDTMTAFAGAIASFLNKIPLVHVEAGLRTLDQENPWPEEGLRQMIARVTTLHLAPTPGARANLMREGIPSEKIHVVGNPGIDTLVALRNAPKSPAKEKSSLTKGRTKLVLITMHRREAFDGGLDHFCDELQKTLRMHSNCMFIWPLHPNPAVRDVVRKHFSDDEEFPNLCLTEPFPYEEMISVLPLADLVISDSGGMQEEAPYCGVPIIVVRDITERPEIIELGLGHIAGSRALDLSEHVSGFLDTPLDPNAIDTWQKLQGQGRSSVQIAELLAKLVS
ncbi:non-hydrolyzing UDP-N-acetylglucosamine 2-epimerase [Thalassospira povalilytica]|uniref:non-hydrolyzing UDP-N-acetylglucosamine 2-epimerase n=1 Tax=Thalassospira povalilytica TaxID=732237 RepID=UPI003AA811A7